MAEGDGGPQVEVEIALRDTASSVLKDIAKNIDVVSRKLVETGKHGKEAFEKVKQGADETGLGSKGAANSLSGLSKGVSDLAKSLAGPVGLAATFVGVAIGIERVLKNFAAHRVQLQLMTVDIGFSTETIDKYQQMLSRMGILNKDEQKQYITGWGSQLKELKNLREYSDMWVRLRKLDDPDFTQKFIKSVYRDDFAGAMDQAAARYTELAKKSRSQADFFAQQMRIPPSILKDWARASKDTLKVVHASAETAAELAKKTEILENKAHTAQQLGAEATIKSLLQLEKTYDGLEKQIKSLVDTIERAQKSTRGTGPAVQPNLGTGPARPPQPNDPRFDPKTFAPSPGKRSSLDDDEDATIPGKARPVQFTRASLTMRDINDTEKDSNRTLIEIRDLLALMEEPIEPGTSGADGGGGMTFRRGIRGGGVGPYGSTRGTTFRRGIRGGGRVGGPIDPGGDPSLVGNEFLASQRKRFKEELDKDPALKKELAAIASLEHESDPVAVIESLMNCMAYSGKTLRQGMRGGLKSFYGPVRRGLVGPRMRELEKNPRRLKRLMDAIDAAAAGSNLVEGYTDQGSRGDPNYEGGGRGINRYGERYNLWGGGPGGHAGARKFREEQQRQVRRSAEEARRAAEEKKRQDEERKKILEQPKKPRMMFRPKNRPPVIVPIPIPKGEPNMVGLDGLLGRTGGSRSGKATVTVDFGDKQRAQEARNVFHNLKLSSGRQGQSVVGASVLPGDVDYSRWSA